MQNNNLKLKIITYASRTSVKGRRSLFDYSNSILKRKCEEVKEITEEIKILGQRMIETMRESQGVGLAASQVGELKRIIIIQMEKGPRIFINPEIIKKSKETETMEEGCLSFPGLFLKIKRAKMVEIEALNESGEKIQFKVDGFIACIFQHEIDHLDGVLFINRISFFQKLCCLLKI